MRGNSGFLRWVTMTTSIFIITLTIMTSSVQAGPTSRIRRMINISPESQIFANETQNTDMCTINGKETLRSSVTCEEKSGCRKIETRGECCPTYQCDCVVLDKIYENGAKLYDPKTPCTGCICQGGEIKCHNVTCYTRNDCGNVTYTDGVCCPEYTNCPPIEYVPVNGETSKEINTPNDIHVISTKLTTPKTLVKLIGTSTIAPTVTTSNNLNSEQLATTVKPVNPDNPLGIKIKEITKPEEIRITDDRPKPPFHSMRSSSTTTTTTPKIITESSTTESIDFSDDMNDENNNQPKLLSQSMVDDGVIENENSFNDGVVIKNGNASDDIERQEQLDSNYATTFIGTDDNDENSNDDINNENDDKQFDNYTNGVKNVRRQTEMINYVTDGPKINSIENFISSSSSSDETSNHITPPNVSGEQQSVTIEEQGSTSAPISLEETNKSVSPPANNENDVELDNEDHDHNKGDDNKRVGDGVVIIDGKKIILTESVGLERGEDEEDDRTKSTGRGNKIISSINGSDENEFESSSSTTSLPLPQSDIIDDLLTLSSSQSPLTNEYTTTKVYGRNDKNVYIDDDDEDDVDDTTNASNSNSKTTLDCMEMIEANELLHKTRSKDTTIEEYNKLMEKCLQDLQLSSSSSSTSTTESSDLDDTTFDQTNKIFSSSEKLLSIREIESSTSDDSFYASSSTTSSPSQSPSPSPSPSPSQAVIVSITQETTTSENIEYPTLQDILDDEQLNDTTDSPIQQIEQINRIETLKIYPVAGDSESYRKENWHSSSSDSSLSSSTTIDPFSSTDQLSSTPPSSASLSSSPSSSSPSSLFLSSTTTELNLLDYDFNPQSSNEDDVFSILYKQIF